MLTIVVVTVFLLLPVESTAYTFSGWTVNGSFTCHCEPDVQCDAKTGACPGGVCGIQQADHPWGDDTTCQTGDVALSGTADQTGDSVYTAQGCIAGYREYNESLHQLRTYCHPHRADGQLSWSLDFGQTFVVFYVNIGPIDERTTIEGRVYNTYGAEVYVSESRTPTPSELCGLYTGTYHSPTNVQCSDRVGRYVHFIQPNVNITAMKFQHVQVFGYQYYACNVIEGQYRFGAACSRLCNCQNQCDLVTGECEGNCNVGWQKYNGVCREVCRNCDSLHGRSCNGTTGECYADCDLGYTGFNCQSQCDAHHFGANCAYQCHCQRCDNYVGICVPPWCDAGYYGEQCHDKCLPGTWGRGTQSGCPNDCHCTTTCNTTNGHCGDDCVHPYIGDNCSIIKPSLINSTISFEERKDTIILTISNIEYQPELVSEYVLQYKLYQHGTFMSTTIRPASGRKVREVTGAEVVLHVPFTGQSINSRYEFLLTPLISTDQYSGVGTSSELIQYSTGCLQYSGLPSCKHWCLCSLDPGVLCLLTCDYCHTCDSEPLMPSDDNVYFVITNITIDSMTLKFKGLNLDVHLDLPIIFTFITHLDNQYANISFSTTNAEHTFRGLSSNTEYAIEVTAVLENGVVGHGWTLTASTLKEASDTLLPVVIGVVVAVIGIAALSMTVFILIRRKGRQSQDEEPVEEPIEPYDYVEVEEIGKVVQAQDHGYLVPVVPPNGWDIKPVETPSDAYESLDSYACGQRKVHVYDNETK